MTTLEAKREILTKFKTELIELCRKHNVKIISGDEDDGISIEIILSDDGYSKKAQDKIWSIGPDGIIEG